MLELQIQNWLTRKTAYMLSHCSHLCHGKCYISMFWKTFLWFLSERSFLLYWTNDGSISALNNAVSGLWGKSPNLSCAQIGLLKAPWHLAAAEPTKGSVCRLLLPDCPPEHLDQWAQCENEYMNGRLDEVNMVLCGVCLSFVMCALPFSFGWECHIEAITDTGKTFYIFI